MAKNKSHVVKSAGVVKLLGHPDGHNPTVGTLTRSGDPLQPLQIDIPDRGFAYVFSRQEMRAMRNFINEILDEDEG